MRLAIIYGGKSVEHEISIRTAINVFSQTELLEMETILIGIDKSGKGYLQELGNFKSNPNVIKSNTPIYFFPGNGITNSKGDNLKIDCVIPLIHGTYGEDGCLQGALELSQIPYVGENVATSALCMDKHLTKIILQQSNINVAPFLVFFKNESLNYKHCSKILGKKLIIKPASSGSSLGVTLVDSEKAFKSGFELARTFSDKILVETYIEGREINCAIFGTPPVIGNLGEIININAPIYSYEEKYLIKTNELKIPANLPKSTTKNIKLLALNCFQTLNCKSMARVDIFFDKNKQLYINEVNTIPAFSKNSIYPKLLESIGISQKSLILSLINQAIKVKSFYK